MSVLQIPTAEVFVPLLEPARYKGAYGGRGSGKSHFFAEMLIDDAMRNDGLRAVCIREVQKSLKESAKRLIEDKIRSLNVSQHFEIQNEQIKTPGDGVIIFQGMQDHTSESIKSLEGFDRAWCEESQTLSSRSLQLLRPTIRKDSSELWFSWNPRREIDPVDQMLRVKMPTNSVVVNSNWSDNPWFPNVLKQERLDCLYTNPDQYDHIWEGGYVTVAEGAYFARHLADARHEKRIGRIPRDPLMTVKLFCDIGGTGTFSDAFTIWAAQFVGHEIRVLNYYEAVGQPVDEHLYWMRENDYLPGNAEIWLPHDGRTGDRVFDVSYESVLIQAGYNVTVVDNRGKGAAMARVAAARSLFPSIYFNEATCKGGLDALGWYHEKKDENRNIGLGPEHDWSSHGADAFGLMCTAYYPPRRNHHRSELEPEETEDY
ncbi:MAG: PBSX family phage terminase large subunit [Gammaproteobacteria bacterium]|nr:PBSX family phage terminase large subunit [Gammaproteobacteria bacterium]